MKLDGKQKRFLRGLASKEKAVFQIGKEGLSDNLYNGIRDYLDVHELVKVSVLKSCDLDMNEIAIELCARTNSELVQKIGKTVVLFRQSKDRIIDLP